MSDLHKPRPACLPGPGLYWLSIAHVDASGDWSLAQAYRTELVQVRPDGEVVVLGRSDGCELGGWVSDRQVVVEAVPACAPSWFVPWKG